MGPVDRARAWWRGVDESQRLLYWVGVVLIAAGAFHAVVFLVKGGPATGPVSWRKPMLFGFSIGVTALALAYVTPFLTPSRKLSWWLMGTLGVAGVVEVFLISMQQWRGVASHFNFFTTKLDRVIAATVAGMITPVAVVIVILFARAFSSRLKAPASMALAIRTGLALMMLGVLVGGTMIANAVTQFVNHTGRPPNIFGGAGVMKVPHGLCLHGIQVMLALAWLLRASRWSEAQRTQVVRVGAAGYCGLVLAMVIQTYTGHGPFELLPPAMVALIVGALLLIGAFVAALLGARSGMLAGPSASAPPAQG